MEMEKRHFGGTVMEEGKLVEFMCIGAGKHDNPKYSKDGTWRVGLLIEKTGRQNPHTISVLYMGELFKINKKQVRKLGVKNENV